MADTGEIWRAVGYKIGYKIGYEQAMCDALSAGVDVSRDGTISVYLFEQAIDRLLEESKGGDDELLERERGMPSLRRDWQEAGKENGDQRPRRKQ